MKILQKKGLTKIILGVFMLVLVSQSKYVFAADIESPDSSSLVMELKMDEESGNVVSDSTGKYTGQAVGTTIVDGVYGKARSFDGADDYIKFDSTVIPIGKKTLRFKVKASVPADNYNCPTIFCNADSLYTQYGLECWISKSGAICFRYANASSTNVVYTIGNDNVDICDNMWHDVIFTFNNTTAADGVKLYIDGKLVAKAQATVLETTASHNLIIGNLSAPVPKRFFAGEIDNFQIYNDVLEVPNAVLDIEPEKDKIKLGEEVNANLVIDNIQNIAAEDVRIKYDSEKLQYTGCKEVDGIKLVYNDEKTGELRFILASKGEGSIVNAKITLLKLKFIGIKTGEALVDITKGRVTDGIEMEKDLTDKECDQAIITIEGTRDVNNSGEFTLLDLGIDARHLNKDPKAAELLKYNTDVVVNNAIDDNDLLEIGKYMLLNSNYSFNN